MSEDYCRFRKKHKCMDCIYGKKSQSCYEAGICKYDDFKNDICSECPYKGPSGTCIGFCTKKLLKQFKGKRQESNQ